MEQRADQDDVRRRAGRGRLGRHVAGAAGETGARGRGRAWWGKPRAHVGGGPRPWTPQAARGAVPRRGVGRRSGPRGPGNAFAPFGCGVRRSRAHRGRESGARRRRRRARATCSPARGHRTPRCARTSSAAGRGIEREHGRSGPRPERVQLPSRSSSASARGRRFSAPRWQRRPRAVPRGAASSARPGTGRGRCSRHRGPRRGAQRRQCPHTLDVSRAHRAARPASLGCTSSTRNSGCAATTPDQAMTCRFGHRRVAAARRSLRARK